MNEALYIPMYVTLHSMAETERNGGNNEWLAVKNQSISSKGISVEIVAL